MHFDQRTQAALRDAGLSRAEIRRVSKAVAEATSRDAEAIESFFDGVETVHSDMEMAHSSADVTEHAVQYVDLYTHGAEIRGYLRFDSWGVPVEGGRVLGEEKVELTLGGTVNDRVRFVRDPAQI
ncbi:DUF7532 family protein [Salinigranum marinum]|uniref:DUF7532 family protein n=1 Tax=Salinigranum marinum TaxID=1515595 RepID=UPI002989D7C0|nr:hypothetical protein [Salinigranum marinum]